MQPVTETLNPDFKNEFHFECRKDCKAQMVLELWDYDMPCDDYIGCCTVSVSTLVAQKKIDKSFEVQDKDGLPVRNETSRKPTKLRLGLSYNTVGEQGESEWLNGLVRKGYRCFGQDVDAKLHEVLTAALSSVRLPVVGSLLALKADGVSIGSEAPFLNELRLLPTRSAKDIQLRAQVRWVTSADFGLRVSIGVKWLNKLGLGLSASVSNLEIDFPVWIQVHLNQDLTSVVSKIQVAATAEPKVRLALSLGVFSTSSLPGVAEALELAIRKALTNVLVLPRKVSKALGQERPVLCSELERAGVARVSIKILEAQDIEDVQAMHKLDPYVVVRMLGSPAEKRGIPKYGMPQIYRCDSLACDEGAKMRASCVLPPACCWLLESSSRCHVRREKLLVRTAPSTWRPRAPGVSGTNLLNSSSPMSKTRPSSSSMLPLPSVLCRLPPDQGHDYVSVSVSACVRVSLCSSNSSLPTHPRRRMYRARCLGEAAGG